MYYTAASHLLMSQVNVAMTTSKTGPTKQPAHFSRGSLMLTYEFIRTLQPGLHMWVLFSSSYGVHHLLAL